MNSAKQSYFISRFVILFSFLIAVCLGAAVWNMNPWPTDAETYYLPAALRIPHIQYLSEIHVTEGMEKVRWLHGKEFYVVGISFFQFMLNDFESLRPFMLLGLAAIAISSILIFYIARRLWGEWIALGCYFAFALNFWPYIYILFAKHQILGLMLFLLSVVFLLNSAKLRFWPAWVLLSGLSLGASFFSSTVSSLYVFYYFAVFFFVFFSEKYKSFGNFIKSLLARGLLVVGGTLSVFIYVNLPDVFLNIKNCAQYVHISGAFNHFYYNQVALQQWFAHINVGEIRAGWIWVLKYLFLILPILLPVYFASVIYLCGRIFKEKSWVSRLKILGMIFLSISSPAMAEAAKVAQYGSNYFPTIVGIIVLIAYALSDLAKKIDFKDPRVTKRVRIFFLGFLVLYASMNLFIFVNDVYVPRMATTFLSEKIKSLGVDRLATYRVHFHRNQFVFCLNAKLRENLHWYGIKSLEQVEQGYVIVPPATGDSIYVAASTSYNNFDEDPVLVGLLRNDLLKNCAVASYRTLASSRIWQQEEEILSYRDLILNHRFPQDALGRVWLLDAAKVKAQKGNIKFSLEDRVLLSGKVNNIGTAEKFYMFEGQRLAMRQTTVVRFLLTQVWKKGNPDDSLVVSVYRTDPNEPIWLPLGKNFTSEPLTAEEIKPRTEEGIAVFYFKEPLVLNRGVYNFVIYRTGKPDDKNYYQIDSRHFAVK